MSNINWAMRVVLVVTACGISLSSLFVSTSSTTATTPIAVTMAGQKKQLLEIDLLLPPIDDSSSANAAATVISNTTDWERELFTRLDRIRKVCGDLCSINDNVTYHQHLVLDTKGSANFPMISVPNVDCEGLFSTEDIDASDATYPFPPPSQLVPGFSLNGIIPQLYPIQRKDGAYLGKESLTSNWTLESIEHQLLCLKDGNVGKVVGSYGSKGTLRFYEKIRQLDLKNKTVLVIGSERPWIEVILLHYGVKHVTTLEYGTIHSAHDQLTTMTPTIFRQHYQQGKLPQFDLVVSHSSLEHCGLGRYGDALNPWGDILAMARAWCVAAPNAKLYLGLPTGQDMVIHNSNRAYGKVRWPLVAANWRQIDGDAHTEEEFQDDHTGFKRRFGGTGFLFEKVTY